MLGAAHACVNPLTARFNVTHGEGLAVLLPHVVRWNQVTVGERYAEFARAAGLKAAAVDADALAGWLAEAAAKSGLPQNLRVLGVPREAIAQLAADAAEQWTGAFNPRPFSAEGAREIFEMAWSG
jgi:alcohol dehydrogenase